MRGSGSNWLAKDSCRQIVMYQITSAIGMFGNKWGPAYGVVDR